MIVMNVREPKIKKITGNCNANEARGLKLVRYKTVAWEKLYVDKNLWVFVCVDIA